LDKRCVLLASVALALISEAFFDGSLLNALHFSLEFNTAIYLPVLLPILIPVVTALLYIHYVCMWQKKIFFDGTLQKYLYEK